MRRRINIDGILYEEVEKNKVSAKASRKIDDELEALFDELVPPMGKADTVAGEIVRALMRIMYRYYNDGDRIDIDYGRETCNPAARYLMANTNSTIKRYIEDKLWGNFFYKEKELNHLAELVIDYIEDHPNLRDKNNSEDMFDYADPIEDVDYDDEEDDYWDDEDDW